MDIKDFILIGGGLLIAAVVAHGFWIAWRARREPLRLDIVPNLFPENVDDIGWLRGELPNGGARVIQPTTSGEQVALDLDSAPLLLEPSEPEARPAGPMEPSVGRQAAPGATAGRDLSSEGVIPETPDIDEEPIVAEEPAELAAAQRAKVAGVVIPEDAVAAASPADSAPPPAAKPVVSEPLVGEPVVTEPVVAEPDVTEPVVTEPIVAEPVVTEPIVAEPVAREPRRPRRLAAKPEVEPAPAPEPPAVEELLILNVVAPYGNRFTGAELFAALRRRGLKFGDMNIFHRVEPLTKMVQYSVANVVEPGTFDVADMDEFRSPGMCFFLQLPGPDHPADVLEDMFEVASAVSTDLRGELRDEQHNLLTPQMVEHYRQRIMDYTRRRMSKRA